MLPPGFEWRPWLDGPALYLRGQQIASITPLDGGRCRVCLNSNNARTMRYQFCRNEAAAIAYVERWAAKWEAVLRAGV